MKKLLNLVILLFASTIAVSQNVGIGTTTPAAKLDVKSGGNYVSQFNGIAPMYLGLYENDVYRGYWGSFSGAAEDVDFGTGPGNTTGKLHLTIQSVPRLTIGSNGNVGVGTTNPLFRHHVEGGDGFFNTMTGFFRFGSPTTNQWRIGTTGTAADLTWYTSPDATTFTARHSFQQNGNIGFGTGTVAPISRLDIMGAGTTSSTNTFTLRNSQGDTLFRMRDDGRMGIGYNGSSYGRTINLGGTGINFYTSNEVAFGGAIFPTDTSLVIWSNSGSANYLVFQPSWGNTGIGTYTPNAKFHLNGAQLIGGNTARIAAGHVLSVDGRVIAEEVTVQNSTSWPDYVFEKNYKLMSLEELSLFIKNNKHLPNIPAASVVEKEGIQLGEMNRKLMEKVEELTLYILELNKRIKVLEEKTAAKE